MHKATGLFRQKIKFKAREDLPGPVALRLDGLQFQVRPANPSGATLVTSPLGVPYIQLSHKGLKKGDKGSITAVFEAPDQASLGVTPVILAGGNM
jgi:hypothetical protein